MSTFRELFDDYKDALLSYSENIIITQYDFMRKLTRAQQQFQRDTHLVEEVAKLPRVQAPITVQPAPSYSSWFVAPADLLEIIEIQDECGHTILSQGYMQMRRNQQVWDRQHTRTPEDYSRPLDTYNYGYSGNHYYQNNSNHSRDNCCNISGNARLFSMVENDKILIHPDNTAELFIYMVYYPDLEAFSSQSPQWSAWFPEDNFDTLFNTTGINNEIKKYEQGVLSYAIAKVVERTGSPNYKIYENDYYVDVKKAIEQKPMLNREILRDYHFAPYI